MMSNEADLKLLVSQLRAELEQEKTKSKAALENEQNATKKLAEELAKTLKREKEKELKLIHESVSKEYNEQLKAVQSEYGEKLTLMESKVKMERSKIREELQEQIEQELSSKYISERKKMTSEIFSITSQLKSAEEEVTRLKGIIRNKNDLLKEKDEELQSKAERTSRSERKTSKQHMDEMERFRRQLQNKEKELSQMAEKLSHAMADKDRLDEEVRKLKQTDTWVRRSTTPTSPSLSPSTSIEELTAVTKQVSRRERDMVIRNSELSFRVRTLEDSISKLRGENTELKAKLAETRSQLAPLKEHSNKLNIRINELNSSLRSKEKKTNSLSQEILELKTAKQQLEEEHVRQRKSLQQAMTKCSSFRTEVQKLTNKNESLNKANARLLVRVDRLETENEELEERVRNFTLTSPTPLSPAPYSLVDSDDDTASIASTSSSVQLLEQISQMKFNSDETEIKLTELSEKYQEMKTEYFSEREKNKSLRSGYETSQRKLRELQTSFRQELNRREQLEKEKLLLEGELDRLRRSSFSESLYDEERETITVESLQEKVDELQSEVDKLQEFVIEQDAIWIRQEEVWNEEKETLLLELEQLQQQSSQEEQKDSDQDHSEPEEPNSPSSEELSEVADQLSLLRVENAQLSDSLAAKTEEIVHFQASNAQLHEDLSSAAAKLVAMEEENSQIAESLVAKSEEVAHLLQASKDLNSKISLLQVENIQLSENLARKTSDIEHLEALNSQMSQNLSATADKVDSLTQENAQLSKSLAARTEELTSLEASNRQMVEDPSISAGKVTSLQEVIARLSKDLEREKVENLEVKAELDRVHRLLKAKELEHSTHVEKLVRLEEQVSRSQESLLKEKTESEPDGESPSATALRQAAALNQLYQQELEQKNEENAGLQDSLSLAQENIAELRALLDGLNSTLHAQTEEHQSILTDKDQHISQLADQLSLASSKLTRLRRTVPVGVNHQMASELGHKVKDALRKLSTEVRSSSGSNSGIVSQLRSLEKAVNELLHTLFPGSFDAELTPMNSETNLDPSVTSELSSTPEYKYENSVDVSLRAHTPTRYTPLTASHSSPPPEDEIDSFSPQGIPPTFPIKSRESSPGKHIPAWRETSPPKTFSFPTELGVSGGKSGLKDSLKRVGTEQNGLEEPRVFVAVMDYEPKSLCVTGRPDNEISFTTGAVLAVHGDMDNEGYYTATFEGKTGRVPANFIQEVEVSDQVAKNRLFDQTLGSPLTSDSYGALSRHTLLTTITDTNLTQSPASNQTNTTVETTGMGCPLPPTHFKVDKTLGNSVLLVTWKPPKMDTSECDNRSGGCLVTGYQLYVNGETKTLISGATQVKATLVGINLSQPLTLGISTSAANGKSSKVITIHHLPQQRSGLRSPTPEPEQYRMFIALYDYDPTKSSPCEHPEFELSFCEGDLIRIFGEEMDDGFMAGELNGQRGLVPASFVSEVKKPQIKEPNWRESMTESLRLTPVSLSAPKLPETSTPMVALFDYKPERDSPNPNPDMELEFKKGDKILVYGSMHGDGYYSGKLGDKFGLVPSNYLTKKKSHFSHPLSESYEPPTTPTPQQPESPSKKGSNKKKPTRSNGLPSPETQPSKQDKVKSKKHSSTPNNSASKSSNSASPKKGLPNKSNSASSSKKATGSPSEPKKKRQGFKWSKQS